MEKTISLKGAIYELTTSQMHWDKAQFQQGQGSNAGRSVDPRMDVHFNLTDTSSPNNFLWDNEGGMGWVIEILYSKH